jgi:predicted PurR-regulated permease PerM
VEHPRSAFGGVLARIEQTVQIHPHVKTACGALKNWFIAQCYDALAVACMWGLGLFLLHVPFAIFWALLGGAFQFIPNFGPLLTLIGPVLAVALSGHDMQRLLYVLILYAVIAVVDGLLLQPYLMKRSSRVPLWASILVPIVMGFIIPFWGVLLAPPLLAVYYTFRNRGRLES